MLQTPQNSKKDEKTTPHQDWLASEGLMVEYKWNWPWAVFLKWGGE